MKWWARGGYRGLQPLSAGLHPSRRGTPVYTIHAEVEGIAFAISLMNC
jgi:hypothetical protein